MKCACAACARLEASRAGTAWKRVPPRVERVEGIAWTDGDWERLGIPIGVAFFQRSSATAKTHAFYPSPAGAVESEIAGDLWDEALRANPRAGDLEPDVEALLVHRVGRARASSTASRSIKPTPSSASSAANGAGSAAARRPGERSPPSSID